jgi:hypothetical protein
MEAIFDDNERSPVYVRVYGVSNASLAILDAFSSCFSNISER